ncbi:MAG: type VI secretion system tip protein TssI/VgrG [Planctomycetota bacterium]
MADAPRVVTFHSGGVADDTFLVSSFEGTEAMSTPYRFELELLSEKRDVDLGSVLKARAWLGLKAPVRLSGGGFGARVLKIHGMVCSIRQQDELHEWTRYQVALVPRLWRLSTDVMTRIFIDKSVPEMIEEILKEEGFEGADYEFRCAKGQKREFAVQYQESDLDFFSRWLEHEGICYFFEQSDDGEKIVFADSTAGYRPLPGSAQVHYRPIPGTADTVTEEAAPDAFREEVVRTLTADQQVIPRKVILKDYNWRKPSQDLKVDSDVVPEGMGTVYYYADHYKDTAEGKALAKIRAEELHCRQKIWSGTSNHRNFRAGTVYQLASHYRPDSNQEYLITSVHHRAEQFLGLTWTGIAGTTYGNEFTSIPKAHVFRPERKTPWPAIHGIMNAKIDGSGDGKYAEIDDMGRYKVLLPFDLSGRSGGKASRYVRMAQPYAGGGMGMHFPLCKGTEVLLAFLDGDPDRPIIVGAVPNPETASPVTGTNHTQNAIQTGGGNKLVLEDSGGSQQIHLSSPTMSSHISLGAPNSPGHLSLGSAGNMFADLGGDNKFQAKGNEDRTVHGSTFWTHLAAMLGGFLGGRASATKGKDTSVVTGQRIELTGGNIVTTGNASRAEIIASAIASRCKNMGIRAKSVFFLNAGSIIYLRTKSAGISGTAKVIVRSGGTNATWTPGSWALKSKEVTVNATTANYNSSAATTIDAKGDLTLKGAKIALNTGGKFNIDGKPVTIKGSKTTIGGGDITLDNNVKVTKDVEITGNLKAKGTNLEVT